MGKRIFTLLFPSLLIGTPSVRFLFDKSDYFHCYFNCSHDPSLFYHDKNSGSMDLENMNRLRLKVFAIFTVHGYF